MYIHRHNIPGSRKQENVTGTMNPILHGSVVFIAAKAMPGQALPPLPCFLPVCPVLKMQKAKPVPAACKQKCKTK